MSKSTNGKKILQTVCIVLSACVLFLLLCGCFDLVPQKGQITLTVTQTPLDICVGESVTLQVNSSDQSATCEWYSADESIVTVVDGKVTGLSVGETHIVAVCGNLTAMCEVRVSLPQETTPAQPDESSAIIVLTPVTVKVGQSVELSAVSPTGHTHVWSSANPEIASVVNGKVTGLSAGETTVSVVAGRATATTKVVVVANPSGQAPLDGYRMVWNDEFEGTRLDNSKWGYQLGVQDFYGESVGPMYWGNNELQYYTDSTENVGVVDGCLYITAKRQNAGDRPYTSARIVTRNKFSFTYGYVEAKIKLPAQIGMWPAFWMLPEPAGTQNSNNVYGWWPTSGEIDIMEAKGRLANQIDTTLHFSQNGHRYATDKTILTTPISEWHTYGVEWTSNHIAWFVDGKQVMKLVAAAWKNDSLPTGSAPFDQPFFLLLNLAVGGSYDGGVQPEQSFTEGTMLVDYVRVWQK